MKRKIKLPGSFSAYWIRYSAYELIPNEQGHLYISPAKDAVYTLYNPFDEAEALLMALLKLGSRYDGLLKNPQPSAKKEEALKNSVLQFAKDYGLMGFASAGVYNRDVLGEEEVILMADSFLLKGRSPMGSVRNQVMPTETYIKAFTPFAEEGDLQLRRYRTSIDLIKAEDSPKFYGKRPLIMDLIFSRFYAEQMVWLLEFARMLSTHFDQLAIYQNSSQTLTEPVTILADRFMASKIGLSVVFEGKAEIAWEFDSLKTAVQTIYGFAISDETIRLNRCEHCQEIYIAQNDREKYCGSSCRNRANVKKSRARKELLNENG